MIQQVLPTISNQNINLHSFSSAIYMSFITESHICPQNQITIEDSFIGSHPIWLHKIQQSKLKCRNCLNQSLTFIGQIFCPLQSKECYNRILYFFYCEKCMRQFRCFRQQSSSNWSEYKAKHNLQYKIICKQIYILENEEYHPKTIQTMLSKAKNQLQNQRILQEELSDQDKEEQIDAKEFLQCNQMYKQVENFGNQNIEQLEKNQTKTAKIDKMFEIYRRVIVKLGDPILMYSNIPIPYNNTPLNPQHQCPHCFSKMSLQVQLTERLLLFHQNLLINDWGCIMVYTCTASCSLSDEQCMVVQYEVDAILDIDIKQLQKKQKNKKKKFRKKNKKIKNMEKMKNQQNEIKQQQEIGKQSEKGDKSENNDENDWN